MWFETILLALAVTLIVVLLLQARGMNPSVFGQAESTFRVRRGIEKILFRSTIGLTFVFVVVAILNVRFDW